jgi:multiple sugar transport system permease protein
MRRLLRLALIALALIWSVGPILLVVASSFKQARDIFATPPRLFFIPTLDNYAALWAGQPVFFRGLLSSLLVTAGATVLTPATSMPAARDGCCRAAPSRCWRFACCRRSSSPSRCSRR